MAPRPGDDVTGSDRPNAAAQHYFSASPSVASDRRTLRLVLPDLHLDLVSDRGVFAADRIDAGTKALLLDGPPVPSGPADLLDLGAGYGAIAVTLARRAPEAAVWAVEVNARARALCAENAQAADVADRVHVVCPEDVPGHVRFAAIWSNPPIRIGKDALHDLLTRWLERLSPGGAAALVVHRHLGADSLARWLGQHGWRVERRASKAGYRLLDVHPTGSGAPDLDPRTKA